MAFKCHHSLVTPIDWKLSMTMAMCQEIRVSMSPLAGDTY